MPRQPKEQNRDSCIRKLRICLGTHEQPMPQSTLAQALDVSVETIKSLESKRLRKGIPGEAMMEHIQTEFGAVWVAEDEAWMFVTKAGPLSGQNSELWRNAAFDRVTEIDALCAGLISLLGQVSDRKFPAASDAVYNALHEIAKKSGVGWKPGIGWGDRDFMNMDLAIVNVWRNGKLTGNPTDVVGFRRERNYRSEREVKSFQDLTRKPLDFRSRVPLLKAASVKPSSQSRS